MRRVRSCWSTRDPAAARRGGSRARGSPRNVVQSDLGGGRRARSLVVLAVPVDGDGRTLRPRGLVAHLRSDDVLVTDVGSASSGPLVASSCRDDHRCPSASWAGTRWPARSAQRHRVRRPATLFQGATWLLTPGPATAPTRSTRPLHAAAAFERLAAHLRAIGARVLAVSPGRARRPRRDGLAPAAGAGERADGHGRRRRAARQRPGTQMAGHRRRLPRRHAGGGLGPGPVGGDPAASNREAFLRCGRRVPGSPGSVACATPSPTATWRRGPPTSSTLARSARRCPAAASEVGDVLVDLVVPIPDRPGALAEVTTALGTAGSTSRTSRCATAAAATAAP